MNYANKMMQAYATVMKAGGDDSIAYLVAKDMTGWVNENEQVLSEYTQQFDKQIPTKLIYQIGAGFNNYFAAAKYQVPQQSWINFNDTRKNSWPTTIQRDYQMPSKKSSNQKRKRMQTPHHQSRETRGIRSVSKSTDTTINQHN